MEELIRIKLKKIGKDGYLATSPDVQGLVASGRTVSETLEIAQDVAKKILESMAGKNAKKLPQRFSKETTIPLPVAVNR